MSPDSLTDLNARIRDVVLGNDADAFDALQDILDGMDDKVGSGSTLSSDEIASLKSLFFSPWWGGEQHGWNETLLDLKDSNAAPLRGKKVQAIPDARQLINVQYVRHYVTGSGQAFATNLQHYKSSTIVEDCIAGMKAYMRQMLEDKRPINVIRSTDRAFLQTDHAWGIENKRSQSNISGFFFVDGTMTLDQIDPFISNHNHRFLLNASTSTIGGQLMTRWRVEGQFGFNIQNVADSYSTIPVGSAYRLKIANRLAHQLVNAGEAQNFSYFTDWSERYSL